MSPLPHGSWQPSVIPLLVPPNMPATGIIYRHTPIQAKHSRKGKYILKLSRIRTIQNKWYQDNLWEPHKWLLSISYQDTMILWYTEIDFHIYESFWYDLFLVSRTYRWHNVERQDTNKYFWFLVIPLNIEMDARTENILVLLLEWYYFLWANHVGVEIAMVIYRISWACHHSNL